MTAWESDSIYGKERGGLYFVVVSHELHEANQKGTRKMDNGTHSESADINITIKPKDSWDKQISSIRKSGARKAREIRKQGHQFHAEILGPREVQGG